MISLNQRSDSSALVAIFVVVIVVL
jgi:hypothetical protein